jgi:hypothetical protein
MPRNRDLQNGSIVLYGAEIDLDSPAGREFVTDATRAGEGLCSDDDLKAKYEIAPEDWKDIAQNTTLAKAIRAERERRIYNGTAARELAATEFATAPRVLGTILNDKAASPRHRIESARELRTTATAGTENSPDIGPKFIITIDLGAGHVEHFEKDITPMKPLLPTNEVKSDE